ncbi:hypothetical protein RHMOL_Rhmol05G0025500 [Rhododendron molle]|uniref:Uncharacterized protein n=1 Tax=Rhododendron molle TaxID=49168 RepID=A0ACC0NL02_RHOML|nr:hypothetical protein RHMOL_Rhmol05G0025500 [Rhododendron molle]
MENNPGRWIPPTKVLIHAILILQVCAPPLSRRIFCSPQRIPVCTGICFPTSRLSCRRRENLGVDTMEETWSCIPNLLIWMIMKRLQCIDNLHLSAVCKHWLNAFLNFPKEEQIPPVSSCNFPWLMITKDHRGSEREFFSPRTKAKFSVDLPEFAQTFVLHSKNGWVVLLTCKCCKQVPRVFLLNPFTRVKLEMPRPPPFRAHLSAISMLEGTLNCVALVDTYKDIVIAHPGDDDWKTFTIPLKVYQHIVHMFFVEHYCILLTNMDGHFVSTRLISP